MNHETLLFAIALSSISVAGCAADVVEPDDGSPPPEPTPEATWAAWPMLGQGPMHQSRSLGEHTGAEHRSWDVSLGEPVRGSCVIGRDATVYAATKTRLTAISADGEIVWSAAIQLPEEEPPSPAIGPSGAVYIENGGMLDAFDSSGDLIWEADLGGVALSSPTVTADGTIYVAVVERGLVLLDAEGSVFTTLSPSDDGRYSTPAIDERGRINFMQVDSFGSSAWAFDGDGTLALDARPIGAVYGYQAYPVAGPGGATYVSADSRLAAFDGSGTPAWEVSRGSNNVGPAVGADGTIYWASGGPLVALDPAGTELWSFAYAGPRGHTVAVAPDATIYLAGDSLFSIGGDGTLLEELDLGSPVSSLIAIAEDGTVIVGTDDGVLHAR